MAINKKLEYIRNISMMIRREVVTFDPHDRMHVAKGRDGAVLDIHSVYYDGYSGDVCYRLCDDKGLLVIGEGHRRLADGSLMSEQMHRLSDLVRIYTELSVRRSQNISLLEKALPSGGSAEMVFSGPDLPEVCIDRSLDGKMDSFLALSLLRGSDDGALYIRTGDPSTGEDFTYPVSLLTDMGVSSVTSCVRRKLGMVNDVAAQRRQAPARKAGGVSMG